ncbi:MAG: efflux RND transporter periplasmic adaptor subunit [Verrucomicrobiales bacterium]|nr:efflux RND transporter periplasmic adaptor subunit [Verrucomicrobiales bacterium]
MKTIFRSKITHAAIALSFVAGFISSCKPSGSSETGSSSEQSPRPALKVRTAVLKSEQVPVFEEVVGTVRPHLQASVSAKVTGRLLSMKAVPGMKVKKGTVIAEIEAEEMKAALERSQAAYKNSDSDLQRYRKLLASGAATQAEFDAVQSVQLIANATVKETQAMISNATVKAPFDGTITRKLMDTGDLATPGKPLFIVEDSSQLRLEINVAESLANQVTLGEKFSILIAGASSAQLNGTVAEIAPAADTSSRTFLVKLDLQANPALRAGQFGRAYLPRAKRDALLVPSKAVIERGQMDYVFVADQDIARLRIVRTKDENHHSDPDAKTREILAGLESGETVILSPAPELRDGQKIITTTGATSPSKSSSQN